MSQAPLTGIRVLEVGNYMAAPFCAMQLADLGAEVIKVENPEGGDTVRQLAPLLEGEGSAFVRLNRNKRSIALDLKSKEGKAVFIRLAEQSDVVVENLRPGTMRELGLDYDRLRLANRGLIYVAASGWGQDGPLKDQPGMDIMAQARSGLMSITGMPAGDPVKVGVPICDLVCALYGALAAVAALNVRHETGEGQFIDVSLLEAGVSFAVWEAGKYFATGEIPQALGSAHQSNAPYQAIRSKDGWLTIGAATQKTWISFCKALGLESMISDSRYLDMNARHRNRQQLIATIEEVTIGMPSAHWLELLERAGVPCAPIQDYGQVFTDPHLLARDFFWDSPHPTIGEVRQIASPMRFSSSQVRRGSAGPRLGQDTDQILEELGYQATAVEELHARNVVRGPAPAGPR